MRCPLVKDENTRECAEVRLHGVWGRRPDSIRREYWWFVYITKNLYLQSYMNIIWTWEQWISNIRHSSHVWLVKRNVINGNLNYSWSNSVQTVQVLPDRRSGNTACCPLLYIGPVFHQTAASRLSECQFLEDILATGKMAKLKKTFVYSQYKRKENDLLVQWSRLMFGWVFQELPQNSLL